MAKPGKSVYSLKEIANAWSSLWADEVTEDDVLSYARDGQLTVHILVARHQFNVLNRAELANDHKSIAVDGTCLLYTSRCV